MQTVTILGLNGNLGKAVAQAFVAAKWRVIGMGRGNKAQLNGVEFVEGDVNLVADTKRAIADADVVVNAINLPYEKWGNGRAEATLAHVLDALKGSGKTLMFPGNIYNYAAEQHLILPNSPQNPHGEKGKIRVAMEEQLRHAVHKDGTKIINIRMPDFFGPNGINSMFYLGLLGEIKKSKLQYPGDLSLGHSWAYLPDVGRAFVKVAEAREGMGDFENFHYQGHFVTGHQMIAAIQDVLPVRAKVTKMPWGIMGFLGLFIGMLREVVAMRYLWDNPHKLQDPRLDAILGEDFKTPFEQTIAISVPTFLPDDGPMAATAEMVQA